MKKILVTGGTGFLGSTIVRRLLESDETDYVVVPTTDIRALTSLGLLAIDSDKLNLINGDLRDYDFIQRLFNEYEIDTIFHLGA